MPKTYPNYIDGQWLSSRSGTTFDDINPADARDIVGKFPASGPADAEEAIAAAERALPDWTALSAPDRGKYLLKAADILERRADEVAAALTRDEGKTLAEARGETLRAVLIFRYYGMDAYHATGDVIPSTSAGTLMFTRRVPVGIVVLVTPWNFPIAIPVWKLAPAVAYGNTVVLKPSSLAPLTAHLVAEVLHEANLPPGVVNLIHGPGGPISETLVSPPVKAVSFTGSSEVGRGLAMRAAEFGIKYQLEMGGKNPAIVLPDANLDQAVDLTTSGAFRSAGEKCTATSRAIVVGPIIGEFTKRLVEKTKKLKLGPGTDPEAYLGPVITKSAQERILAHIELGKKEGARLLFGGGVPKGEPFDRGFYVEPTVFGDVRPEMKLAQEEIFGPVLAIIGVETFDEAIAIANGTRYGLSASIFTRDLDRVLEYADRIEAGLVRVNGETAGVEPQAPFGGFKGSSSFSREQGRAAIDFFTQIKTVYFDRAGG